MLIQTLNNTSFLGFSNLFLITHNSANKLCKMKKETFIRSLNSDMPLDEASPALQALWYDAQNDWDGAHKIAQEIQTSVGSAIHAYLHRKEGDNSNASYWYLNAGTTLPNVSFEEEWLLLVEKLTE